MHQGKLSRAWLPAFNDNDALIPEVWAQEALMVLEERMVAANLVYRDYSAEVAQKGDTVNAHRPREFEDKRKADTSNVTIQDAISDNVPVKLNQQHHVSFLIRDGEESKSFKELRALYLTPAARAIARGIDQMVLAQVYQFLANTIGKLGTDATKALVIEARQKANELKWPDDGRQMLVTPESEAALLNVADFVNAEKVGDDGSALREGSIGRKFGFNIFMAQNVPSVPTGSTVVTGAVNNGAGYAAGSTTITVDGFSAAIANGTWCTLAGDMTPQMITGTVGGATPTQLTIAPGLRSAVVDDAVVTVYTPGAIDLGAGYAAGWEEPLVIDGFTVAPKVGQMFSIGDAYTDAKYAPIGTPTTISILPDRPLDAAVADDDAVGVGPAGNYNIAFHKNAIALVTRPLATPAPGTGAASFVAEYNNLAIRVTITYNGEKQGHLVTVDLLCGVKVLDSNLGIPVLA